ncbi:MAG: DNA polymerase III subunit gamma/tau [Pseudobdellovibrionaceae bacterium]
MTYQVTARKWRPQDFTQLVGQPHISQTLLNALKNNRVTHAFLFTGPRGTGKTSTARILAKSLRCPNAVDFVPCNHCHSCEDISRGTSLDVIEIDGASNNGVDSIRELRDSVSFMPSFGKYKIYIIDEVHMLSGSAFNALLKTLEEPPPHVIFMMATTEAHKIPQTILSRCQRFDFRRISTKVISAHLRKICDAENLEADDEALWLIARQADGSMRDSQSLFDQVISFASGKLSTESVVRILALTDRVLLQDILVRIFHRDSKGILELITRMNQIGVEPEILIAELLEMVRNCLFYLISPDQLSSILDVPDNEVQFYKDISKTITETDCHLIFDMAMKSQADISAAPDSRLVMEICLLRMASAPSMMDLKTMLQSGPVASTGQTASPSPQQIKTQNQNPKLTPSQSNTSQKTSTTAATSPSSVLTQEAALVKETNKVDTHLGRWLECIDRIRSEDPRLAAKVEGISFLKEDQRRLLFQFPAHLGFLQSQLSDPATKQLIQKFIDVVWGAGFTFELVLNTGDAVSPSTKISADKSLGDSAITLAQKKKLTDEEVIRQKVEEHPTVKAAQRIFNVKIEKISDLKKPDLKPEQLKK